jgi:hypothetical protein
MAKLILRLGAATVFAALGFILPGAHGGLGTYAQSSSNVSVIASGLNNPRGLRFGPDGALYVAEAGIGGNRSTVGLLTSAAGSCIQPFNAGNGGPGPFTGGYSARISRIDASGARTTVVEGLPSALSADRRSALGVADVEFINGQLYALLPGGGCTHGNVDVPASVIRVNPDGSWVIVADLTKFTASNPVKTPDLSDFDPEGTWYSMLNVNGDLYVVNPNGSDIDKVSPLTTQVTRLVDMSAEPWIGPTSLAYHNGNLYTGNLGEFPIKPGTENIYQVAPSGQVSTYATGLTTVVAIAFDNGGNLYALELSSAPGGPRPGTGQVVKVSTTGAPQVIASGLALPTGMTLGPDGNLYVSNGGSLGPGNGQILKIQIAQ